MIRFFRQVDELFSLCCRRNVDAELRSERKVLRSKLFMRRKGNFFEIVDDLLFDCCDASVVILDLARRKDENLPWVLLRVALPSVAVTQSELGFSI